MDCKDPGPGMPSSSIGQGGQVARALGKVSATSLQPGLHTAQALATESQKAGQDSTLKSKQATWPTRTISMSTCALGELFLGGRFEGSRWDTWREPELRAGQFYSRQPPGVQILQTKMSSPDNHRRWVLPPAPIGTSKGRLSSTCLQPAAWLALGYFYPLES